MRDRGYIKLYLSKQIWTKCSYENIVDYITRAEDMQLKLSEIDELISEKKFVTIFMKRLPREFETSCTLVIYDQDKNLDENKRELINFESENQNKRNKKNQNPFSFPMIELVSIVTRGGILQKLAVHNGRNLTIKNLNRN